MPVAFLPAARLPLRAPRRHRHSVTTCAASPPPSTEQPTPTPVPTPGTRRIPLLAFFRDLLSGNLTALEKTRRFGAVYKADVLGFPVTMISDLHAINICYKDTRVFRSAGAFPFSLATMFGEKALFILDGKEHVEKRRPVLPAFTPQLFPLYFPSIRQDAEDFWNKVSEQVAHHGTMNLREALKEHYLGIIVRLTTGGVYGTSDKSAEEQFTRMRDLLLDVAKGVVTFPFGPVWWRALRGRDELMEIVSDLVRQRLVTRRETIEALRREGMERIAAKARGDLRAGSLDLLTVLVASSSLPTGAGQALDEAAMRELCQLVMLLWFAGYSTQASSTLCCLMEMHADAKIYARLRKEQDEIVQGCEGRTAVTLEQVNREMGLLGSYINEVLRLFPPAPVLFRKTSEKVYVCGHEIAAGTIVGLDVWGGQRNEKYHVEAEKLKMDRFVDGQETASVVSFGAVGGAHFCLGAALARVGMKTTVAVGLRMFDVGLDEEQDWGYVSVPDMMPRSGVEVAQCERRDGV